MATEAQVKAAADAIHDAWSHDDGSWDWLARAALKAAEAAAWQPIDTSPEKTHVLIGAENGKPAEVCFTLPVLLSYKRDGEWSHSGQEWTHWQPLPDMPRRT